MKNTIFTHIALRDTLQAHTYDKDTTLLTEDRAEEILAVAHAAVYMFTAKHPEFFKTVDPDDPKPDPNLPEETRRFIRTMVLEYAASYTLAVLYAVTDPRYAATHRSRAGDVLSAVGALAAPMSLMG